MGDARGGGAEVEHALDGVGFLEDGELFPLAVLGDHGFELLERVEVEHEAGHGAGAGLFACLEAAVAGDDPVAFAVWYDGQGREEPVGLDAGREVGHVADVFAWIVRVRVDQARVDELDLVALVVAHCWFSCRFWLSWSAHSWRAASHGLGLPVWSYSFSWGPRMAMTCSQLGVH